ncbi:MAG: hypothetical protein LC637_05725 [Xanthomonadaceae bacterium]|nr:hypothetical protein [Xanthomonadaceae bacterium]
MALENTVAVLGCAREIDFTPGVLSEMNRLIDFLESNHVDTLTTGAGGGVPRMFSRLFMDRGGRDFGGRDAATLAGAATVIVLPWGRFGAGSAREIMAALKKKHIRQIVTLLSTSTENDLKARTLALYQAACAFSSDVTDKQIRLWYVQLLDHYRLFSDTASQ